MFQGIFVSKLTWKLRMSSLKLDDECGDSINIKTYVNHFTLPSKMRIREEATMSTNKNTFRPWLVWLSGLSMGCEPKVTGSIPS